MRLDPFSLIVAVAVGLIAGFFYGPIPGAIFAAVVLAVYGVALVVPGLFKLRRVPPLLLRLLLGTACLGLVLLGWFVLTSGDIPEQRILPPNKLPSPGETWDRVAPLFDKRDLIGHMLDSLKRVFMGFGLAVLVGFPLGVLAASWRPIEAFTAPIALFGRNVPFGALVPVTIIIWGLGEKQMRVFIFLATVPFVFAATVAAMLAIHERYSETAKTLGANDRQVVLKVLVPLALPDVITTFRQLLGLAWGYIMLAEASGAQSGAGFLLNQSQTRGGDEGDIWVILFTITIVAFVIDKILQFFQRGLFPYRADL